MCLRCLILPSILNANLANLSAECSKLLLAGADGLHLDVMDGHFVPNISIGVPVVESLRKSLSADVFFDLHMMVSEPARWIQPMSAIGGPLQYTFHYEAADSVDNVRNIIKQIKCANMKVGLALKPGTSVDVMEPFVKDIDSALVMTVEPGFGGQSFMGDMMPKVEHLRLQNPNLTVQVDGGVGPKNIDVCATAGANSIVSGTALVRSDNQTATIKLLRSTVDTAIQARKSAT